MRTPILPLALAAAALAWSLQPGDPAASGASRNTAGDRAPERMQAWHALGERHGLDAHLRQRLRPVLALVDPGPMTRLTHHQQAAVLRFARYRLSGPPRVSRCWAPGTPRELIDTFHALEEAARAQAPPPTEGGDAPPPPATQFDRRWSRTATNGGQQGQQGLPITLTWSIVPDGTPIPSNRLIGDSAGPSDLRRFLARLFPDSDPTGDPREQPWFPILAGAFENIATHTGIRYVYEPRDDGSTLGESDGVLGVRGDIRISGHAIDGERGTLAYNYFPNGGDMVIDTTDEWFAGSAIRLANTVEHEHCHGLGVQHVCPSDKTKLMEPVINLNFRGIQFDEIYTLQRQYGDPAEHHGESRTNDRVSMATPLAVPAGEPFESGWLSIDDDSDRDHFALPLPRGTALTVRVQPSEQRYLEGPQDAPNCTAGEPFDSSGIHNLALELLGPDRTVLASSKASPAGQAEAITNYKVLEAGVHYLRVSGSSANAAQLYRLFIRTEVPEADLAITTRRVVDESFAPANEKVDPDETVVMEFTITNRGTLAAEDLVATLVGPPALVSFSEPVELGTLKPGASVTRFFTFGLKGGDCGDLRPLALLLTGGEDFRKELPVLIRLGDPRGLERETFDRNSTSLPATWSSFRTENASGWSISTIRSLSGDFSAFAASLPSIGESTLLSPSIRLPSEGGVLRFNQSYSLEAGQTVAYDGGVLEVSVGGQPWVDILETGAIFTTGGYNLPIDTGFGSPLGGRRAWSGQTSGFIATAVLLPPELGDKSVRFRWRLAHDSSETDLGWFLEDIELAAECGESRPLLQMEVVDATASEGDPSDTAKIAIHAPLPPIANLPFRLRTLGEARLALDFATDSPTGLALLLPFGQSELTLNIRALPDDLVEGTEAIRLSVDSASGVIGPEGQVAELTLLDSRYGSWAAETLGLEGPVRPLEDFDQDGSSNLEEFAWRSDAAAAFQHPRLNPRREGELLRVDAPPEGPERGVRVRAETSTDLQSWSGEGVIAVPEGFAVRLDGPARYLRLTYELAAPGESP